jgi:hypothetical protein
MASLIMAVVILFLLVTLSPVCAAIAAVSSAAYRSEPPRTTGFVTPMPTTPKRGRPRGDLS